MQQKNNFKRFDVFLSSLNAHFWRPEERILSQSRSHLMALEALLLASQEVLKNMSNLARLPSGPAIYDDPSLGPEVQKEWLVSDYCWLRASRQVASFWVTGCIQL